jgi:erythronate-4-phosphate dehydrogenase
MFQVLADAHILELNHYFPKRFFNVRLYHNHEELKAKVNKSEILLCRSIYPINQDLIIDSPIEMVASATSGSNHIDKRYLESHNIPFLDAKGGNAPAVVDYVCATLASLIKHFSFHPKKIAILGYGHIGQRLAAQLQRLGYEIGVYDPFKPEDIPGSLEIELSKLHDFDTICIHPNYHHTLPYSSHHLINARLALEFSSNTCIINAARGLIVDEDFILSSSYKGLYCTDVFANEPQPNPKLIERATLATPHIAGHSIESKLRLTELIANKIYKHLNLSPLPQSLIEPSSVKINQKKWQTEVLAQYDPIIETEMLKREKGLNFLALRHAHRRHEFSWSNL